MEHPKLNYISDSLISELKKSPTYTETHILLKYIKSFDQFIGSDQKYTLLIANRIGISINLERYADMVDISLRELVYYELFYYIKYVEPNLKKWGFPSTSNIINMLNKDYKTFYDKYKFSTIKYRPGLYYKRMSILTDYAIDKINK